MSSTLEYKRLAECIAAGRKDEVVIDFARLVAAHYGKLVEHASGNEIPSHANKTLMLEAFDIFCRETLSRNGAGKGRTTENVRDIVRYYMKQWKEAMALDNPADYQMKAQGPAPLYVGREEDATCLMLSLCASVDITPIHLKWGYENGKPSRVWGLVAADSNLYDSDVNDERLALGQYLEFDSYDDAEVPL